LAIALASSPSRGVAQTSDDANNRPVVHLDFDTPLQRIGSPSANSEPRAFDAETTATTPGHLISPIERDNKSSLSFNGNSSIVDSGLPSNAPGFSEDFTWEGFFFSPSSNRYLAETGIADRLISQFANNKGDWTRFAIGLVAAKNNEADASLCVELEGTEGRTFGRGTIEVTPDCWHHFAVVHKGTSGAAKVTWYLDHKKCGEVFLGGQANLNRLKPAGTAPLTIGARLLEGKQVNRGFRGLMDEVRLTPIPLDPSRFLRVRETPIERLVEVDLFDGVTDQFVWDFAKLKPTETLQYEALVFVGLPQRFSSRGDLAPRFGAQTLRGRVALALPKGTYRLLLRTSSNAILSVDGRIVVDARHPKGTHPLIAQTDTPKRVARDHFGSVAFDGGTHRFELAAKFEDEAAEDLADVVACYAGEDGVWRLLGSPSAEALSPTVWSAYRGRAIKHRQSLDGERRRAAIERGERQWERRHELARQTAKRWAQVRAPSDGHPIDTFIDERRAASNKPALPRSDDAAFLRRLSLDVRGRIPSLGEIESFLADKRADKRERVIDLFLQSDEWADHWVSYWQDVLAENPSLVFPTLNNSGPFRRWIFESFRQNMAFDRFATELILMEGENESGGTAGFASATKNDSPMAMRSYVIMRAFLAVDLKCARCHDSPIGEHEQKDLFQLAAMLNDAPLTVPATSVAAANPLDAARDALVTTTLKADQQVAPRWPREIVSRSTVKVDLIAIPSRARPRKQLAALVTSPANPRFTDVIVNRVWKRYFGHGLIEPLDNWNDDPEAKNRKLLRYLSGHFARSAYDLKSLARLILTSQAYQRSVASNAPTRRRMTAEQLVDSLFLAAGKSFGGESLTLNATDRGAANLPTPTRSWQFTALPNERGRPALAMPVNQTIVDVLRSFGWNGNRQQPISKRDQTTTALQPLILFNGLMSRRIVRMSESSAITELCLKLLTVDELVEKLFLTVLSRHPNRQERSAFTDLLRPNFERRRTGKAKASVKPLVQFQPDWRKHLQPEQTSMAIEAQARVREGERPTVRLTDDFRERVEDALWALINSPEFVFVP